MGDLEVYTEETFPRELLRKVSTLNTFPVKDYVEGVGINVGGGLFHVQL